MKGKAKQKKRKEKNVSDIVRGYKVFESDWVCKNKKYTCPGRFKEDVELEICGHGMHFCLNAADCFQYYNFDQNNHVAEVIAHGQVVYGDDKCCTDDLEIVREILWDEVLRIINTGKGCTGLGNTGDWNTGNRNTGKRNTGNRNTGDWNTGNRNTGNWNTGNRNAGNWNAGNWNAGDWNVGDSNTGDWNKSSFETGCFNTKKETSFCLTGLPTGHIGTGYSQKRDEC